MQIVIDEVLVNYKALGLKNKSSILILHGWGQSSKNWEYIGNALAKKFKVFLVDLPGFGGSSVPNSVFDTKDYTNLIAKFSKQIIKDDFILIGHSFGGKIAIKMASSANGTKIKRLILISPSGIESKSLLTIAKIFAAKIFKVILFWLPSKTKNYFIRRFGSKDYANANEMRDVFSKIIGESVVNDAKKISTPTIIIWGEKDEEINLKNSKKLKSLIKGSILRVVWGERHSVNIEAPDKLLSIIQDYV